MKGLAGKFVIVLLMFGLFSMVYTALNAAYNPLYNYAIGNISDSDSLNTVSILNIMWPWLPIAVLFSFFVWNIETSRKEREVTY